MKTQRRHICRFSRRAVALGGVLAVCTAMAEPAQPQEPDASAGFHCIVMPHALIDVSSGTAGRLDAVHVERGNTVARNQLVAELESGVERAQVALAGKRAAINTEVHLRQAEQRVDARNADRIATLHASQLISAQQQDAAARDASVAALRVREAREKQRLTRLELVRAEEVLKLRAVRSPINGVVVDRFKWPGEFVEDEPIVRVAQLDPLRVEVILPVAEHGKLRIGHQVDVYPETEPDSPRLATIKVVDPMADPASGTFRATLELPNPGNALLAGIKCRAHLLHDASSTRSSGRSTVTRTPRAPQSDLPSESGPEPKTGAETGPESAPASKPGADGPAGEPFAPRVPGSAAPRAPLRSATSPAPAPLRTPPSSVRATIRTLRRFPRRSPRLRQSRARSETPPDQSMNPHTHEHRPAVSWAR